jgi:dipeptidyl aminopeptidase/acylaminoacyl peptidase
VIIRNVLLASAGLLAIASVPSAAAPMPLDQAAKLFGTRENVRTMDISPSGNLVVMLVSERAGETGVMLADPATGAIKKISSSAGKGQYLRWCEFASETQLVCQVTGTTPYDTSIVDYSRLFTLKTDGTDAHPLGQSNSTHDASIRQFDGAIVDWLPGQSGAVLMARTYVPEVNTIGSNIQRTESGLGLDRVDLASMKRTLVVRPNDRVINYMTDGQGHVRIREMMSKDDRGEISGIEQYEFCGPDGKSWSSLGKYDERDGSGIYPIAVDAGTNSAFVLQKQDGRDALFRISLDGSGRSTLVAADKENDIDGVVRIGRGQRVVGYTFAGDQRRTVYFDSDYTNLQAALAKAIPGEPLIDFVGASADGQKLMIFASGDTHPGTFYRFDRATKHLEEIARARPQLNPAALSPVRSIRVPAADGASVPAYLTLPVGSDGKNLPAVVLPHGGPSSRDEWGFDWLPQFLAARGYAVIQPNYRGSAGYGEQWMAQNGFRGWQTSIGDVTSAAKYLVSSGIADPKRLAIVGWSYGGYAALQSAAIEPALYKAVVAIAPVTDLSLLKKQAEEFNNGDLVADFVGSGASARNGSPLRNAAAIKAPVLLVHATLDANVGIAHSDKMADALRSAGDQVEYLRIKDLDHQLDDTDTRIDMLTHIGTLLDKTIGH